MRYNIYASALFDYFDNLNHKGQKLYYVQTCGWWQSFNIRFIGTHKECLEYLKMTEEQYLHQIEENHKPGACDIEGNIYFEIHSIENLLKAGRTIEDNHEDLILSLDKYCDILKEMLDK